MATVFDNLNGHKLIIGLVHLLPMPSTPLYEEGNLEKMKAKALSDCLALKRGGADGALLQTVDVYYPSGDDTDYARVASLSSIASLCKREVGDDFILGAQIMWNCITPSLAVCKACDLDFTRSSCLVGETASPYGTIKGDPLKVATYRNLIHADKIGILNEISGYHFKGDYDSGKIKELAASSARFGANAIEVMNKDFNINEKLIKDVKESSNLPVILGGGTDLDNCKERLRYADGALVGSAFEDHKWGGPIVEEIVSEYVRKVRELEQELSNKNV